MGKFDKYKSKNFHVKGFLSLIGLSAFILLIFAIILRKWLHGKKKTEIKNRDDINYTSKKREISLHLKENNKEILNTVRYVKKLAKEAKKFK